RVIQPTCAGKAVAVIAPHALAPSMGPRRVRDQPTTRPTTEAAAAGPERTLRVRPFDVHLRADLPDRERRQSVLGESRRGHRPVRRGLGDLHRSAGGMRRLSVVRLRRRPGHLPRRRWPRSLLRLLLVREPRSATKNRTWVIMATMRIWVAVAALAAACNKTPNCKDAIDKALGQLRADSGEAATLIGLCEQQAWSADVRTCVAASKSQAELSACMARDKKLAKAEAAAKEADAAAKDAQDKVNKLTKDLADVDAKLAAGSATAPPDAGVGSGSGSGKPKKGQPAAGSGSNP